MKSPDFEKNIGINTFLTDYEGIGGKLRTNIDDFIVEEVFLYPKEKTSGLFTIAKIACRNWETHRLVREFSKRLKISQNRIGFAGTKDKRASSTQLMSFYNVSKKELSQVEIKDVDITDIYNSESTIKIGNLIGNRFNITVRNIEKNLTSEHIDNIALSIKKYGGFPNFYGIQRFGAIRPITHIIGKHIVNGDFKSAVMDYIANPMKGEDKKTYGLREELQETGDFSKALNSYPNSLNFEKAMLNRLVVDSDDFVGALNELPKNLLMMFVNAYQSYIFNKILSKRIKKNIPLNSAIIGDIITPARNNSTKNEYIKVKSSNIKKVNIQIKKNKAFITGLLVGYDPVFSSGEMGEIENKIIKIEKIEYRDFIIPKIPFLSSKGLRRPILAVLNKIEWNLFDNNFQGDKKVVSFKFDLQKGCYATSLLREFMKSNSPKDY